MSGKPPDEAHHILIVDDDRRIRQLLRQYLLNNQFRVSTAQDALFAREQLKLFNFDLIILDLMMPKESGIEFARHFRQQDNTPILMLTALSEAQERITGLEAGADDYLVKPFEPRELVLRVNSILTRTHLPKSQQDNYHFGPFRYSVKERKLFRIGKLIKLTDRERQILTLFCQNAGAIVSRLDVSNVTQASEGRALDVQINRLRHKIEADPANPVYLQTVRGLGYRLDCQ